MSQPLSSNMAASPNGTVVVPMAVQALVVTEDLARTSAQFAPLVEPDYASLLQRPGAGLPKHDLMDDIPLSYWRMQTSCSTRFVDLGSGKLRSNRIGIYVSWCLPRLYRGALIATETAARDKNWESRRAMSGFKSHGPKDSESEQDKSVNFRPAPDRWVIVRQVRSKPELTKRVLVESNYIRELDAAELLDLDIDVENQTSPAIDYDRRVEEQPMLRMGRSVLLTAENITDEGDHQYRQPFNAFEYGYEFFADYAPHNMGVFSWFDDLADIQTAAEEHAIPIDYLVVGFHLTPEDYDPLSFNNPAKVTPPSLSEGAAIFTNAELLDALELEVDTKVPVAARFAKETATKLGRTLTHGVLRDIPWNRQNGSQKLHWPAVRLQDEIIHEQPIALGTHVLDALTAYLRVSSGEASSPSNYASMLGQLLTRITAAQTGDAEALRRASEDVMGSQSFLSRAEGTIWRLPKSPQEDGAARPMGREGRRLGADEQITQRQELVTLNEGQAAIDACMRERYQLLQQLYGCWWNAASIRHLSQNEQDTLTARTKSQAKKILIRFEELEKRCGRMQKTADGLKRTLEASLGQALEATPTNAFGQHQDPTVLIAGVSSAWPSDFSSSGKQLTRIAAEIAPLPSISPVPETWLDDLLPDIAQPANALL